MLTPQRHLWEFIIGKVLIGECKDWASSQFLTALFKIIKIRNKLNAEKSYWIINKSFCKLVARNLHKIESRIFNAVEKMQPSSLGKTTVCSVVHFW